jgi:Bacterial fructose-1,6-bisphosphatase, glpX-encoded
VVRARSSVVAACTRHCAGQRVPTSLATLRHVKSACVTHACVQVIALAERGTLYDPGPCMYMEKIAVGPAVDPSLVSLDKPVRENLEAVAKALGKPMRCAHDPRALAALMRLLHCRYPAAPIQMHQLHCGYSAALIEVHQMQCCAVQQRPASLVLSTSHAIAREAAPV